MGLLWDSPAEKQHQADLQPMFYDLQRNYGIWQRADPAFKKEQMSEFAHVVLYVQDNMRDAGVKKKPIEKLKLKEFVKIYDYFDTQYLMGKGAMEHFKKSLRKNYVTMNGRNEVTDTALPVDSHGDGKPVQQWTNMFAGGNRTYLTPGDVNNQDEKPDVIPFPGVTR